MLGEEGGRLTHTRMSFSPHLSLYPHLPIFTFLSLYSHLCNLMFTPHALYVSTHRSKHFEADEADGHRAGGDGRRRECHRCQASIAGCSAHRTHAATLLVVGVRMAQGGGARVVRREGVVTAATEGVTSTTVAAAATEGGICAAATASDATAPPRDDFHAA